MLEAVHSLVSISTSSWGIIEIHQEDCCMLRGRNGDSKQVSDDRPKRDLHCCEERVFANVCQHPQPDSPVLYRGELNKGWVTFGDSLGAIWKDPGFLD